MNYSFHHMILHQLALPCHKKIKLSKILLTLRVFLGVLQMIGLPFPLFFVFLHVVCTMKLILQIKVFQVVQMQFY